jgi:hypothetical protein
LKLFAHNTPWSGLSAGHARIPAGILVAQAFLPVQMGFAHREEMKIGGS